MIRRILRRVAAIVALAMLILLATASIVWAQDPCANTLDFGACERQALRSQTDQYIADVNASAAATVAAAQTEAQRLIAEAQTAQYVSQAEADRRIAEANALAEQIVARAQADADTAIAQARAQADTAIAQTQARVDQVVGLAYTNAMQEAEREATAQLRLLTRQSGDNTRLWAFSAVAVAALLAGGFAYGMRSRHRPAQPEYLDQLMPPPKALLAAQTYSLARGVRAWPVQVKTPRGPVWAVRTADGFVPREELRLLTVKEN